MYSSHHLTPSEASAASGDRSSTHNQSFAETQRQTLKEFLSALNGSNGHTTPLSDWVIVLGNTGGDTDSLVSALVYAHHLHHKGQKALSLLQLNELGIKGRPEHEEVLEHVGLTMDDILSQCILLGLIPPCSLHSLMRLLRQC